MPLNIIHYPAPPHCLGTQWSVSDVDQLAKLIAMVLIGRTRNAVAALAGAQVGVSYTTQALKDRLRAQLFPSGDPRTYHRDGLLFEIMCWLAAHMQRQPDEAISEPHLSSTQQGVDTFKVAFDANTRTLTRVVVFEQKCSENARDKFRDEVLPAFKQWVDGTRDNQLTQKAASLLEYFGLSEDEHTRAYDRLVQQRPLSFRAALTVSPSPYDPQRCVALFDGYGVVTSAVNDRAGDTLPLADIRAWFADLAARVWHEIESGNV
jgi:hypothetical protein